MPDSRWNVKRGLNRLFVVSAVCWYIAASFVLWPKWVAALRTSHPPVLRSAGVAPPGTVGEWTVIDRGAPEPPGAAPNKVEWSISPEQYLADLERQNNQRPIVLTLALVLAPPAIYTLAALLVWVARGFRAG